jgi:hypothetical protein
VNILSMLNVVSCRAMERPPIRAISPPGRDRSLSPRSKEVQREMQALRERRSDRKGVWHAAKFDD